MTRWTRRDTGVAGGLGHKMKDCPKLLDVRKRETAGIGREIMRGGEM